MDHGILNVPLAKRGKSIDSQIDTWKRDQAAKAAAASRASAAETKELRQQAKSLFHGTPTARFDELAARCGVPTAQIVAKLKSDAHWQPRLVIALLAA